MNKSPDVITNRRIGASKERLEKQMSNDTRGAAITNNFSAAKSQANLTNNNFAKFSSSGYTNN
jgi:hypothetical protein